MEVCNALTCVDSATVVGDVSSVGGECAVSDVIVNNLLKLVP